jgi:excisionase family DNA binding protein
MPDGTQDPNTDRQTVTVEETAKRLGIGRNTAYDAVRRGDIPSIRIGRRVVVPVAVLERMLTGEATDASV